MTIDVGTLTAGEVKGSGVFDELVRVVKAHLEAEYSAGRISGKEYSEVYLGTLQSVLAQSTQYALSYQIADEQLTQAQTQNQILSEQLVQAQVNTDLLRKQLETAEQQRLLLIQQTAVAENQVANVAANTAVAVKQLEVMTAQIASATAETALVNQNTTNAATQNTVLTNQATKLTSETQLLNQRKLTEEAQILDTVNGVDVAGVIGTQKALQIKQTEGFTRDAEQKAVKILTDIFNIAYSVTDGDIVQGSADYGFNHSNMQNGVHKLLEGIGVTPVD